MIMIIWFLIYATAVVMARSRRQMLRETFEQSLPTSHYFPYTGGSYVAFPSSEVSPHGIIPKVQPLKDVRRWMKESRDPDWGRDDDLVYFYDYEAHDNYNRVYHIQCLCFSHHQYCSCDQPAHTALYLQQFTLRASSLIIRHAPFPHRTLSEAFMISGYTINGTFPNEDQFDEVREFRQGTFLEQPRRSCPFTPGFCELLGDLGTLFPREEE